MSTCKECNKPIVWANIDEKNIPLDPSCPTYFEFIAPDGKKLWKKSSAYVSHFSTCTNPNRFSGSGKPDVKQKELNFYEKENS